MKILNIIDQILIGSANVINTILPKKDPTPNEIGTSTIYWQIFSWIPGFWLLSLYILFANWGVSQKTISIFIIILTLIFEKFISFRYIIKEKPSLFLFHISIYFIIYQFLYRIDNIKILLFLLFPTIIYIKVVTLTIHYKSFKINKIPIAIAFFLSTILFYLPVFVILNQFSSIILKQSYTFSYASSLIITITISMIIFSKKASFNLLHYLNSLILLIISATFFLYENINILNLFH